DKCFACHGPDDSSREGGFRFDKRESATSEADSGEHPIVPGDPDSSEMLRRILSDDEYEQMPPPETNKSLTEEEIAAIRQWIAKGADWQQWWSFTPPKSHTPPAVEQKDWPRNDVDRFILARLEEEGLSPSREADKRTLIRRVTLDLTGLPPTLEEIEAFMADDSPKAYENLVDRLLASPRYGEHMARFWLDAARYGDTHGLHFDNYREMWPYRDYVVEAFNKNMPFDQFAIEQLAGDLLPDPTRDQLIASGFNRCNVTTNEGGSIYEEVYVRNVIDRVETVSTVFMGLTIGCTRCHDHKYDPLTMTDFYSMFAYFNSLDGSALDDNLADPAPIVRLTTPEQEQQIADLEKEITQLKGQLNGDWPAVDQEQRAWEQRVVEAAKQKAEGDSKERSEPMPHGQSVNARAGELEFGPWNLAGGFSGERHEVLDDHFPPETLPIDLQASYDSGFGTEITWRTRGEWENGLIHEYIPVVAHHSTVTYCYRTIRSPDDRVVEVSLGSNDGMKVLLNGEELLRKETVRPAAPNQEYAKLNLRRGINHLILKLANYKDYSGFYFRVPGEVLDLPRAMIDLAKLSPDERTKEQAEELQKYYRLNIATDPGLVAKREQLNTAEEQLATLLENVPVSLVWKELEEPRDAFVLLRGDYDKQGERVSRRPPSTLLAMDAEPPADRLELARWFVDPSHPLTARVTVNRFWQQFFGAGLVKTAEDFGSQGEFPSHPKLLDELSVRFVNEGWDVKSLVKDLVMSATYRQSSHCDPAVLQRDPGNRLLARSSRGRLDAEVLRDQSLAVSGLLVNKLGGPGVRPPQPAGIWKAVGFTRSNTALFVADKDRDDLFRRSLYTFHKRTAPPPLMSVFDAPTRESCVVRRERTNTPLQALMMLNEKQFFVAAKALANRVLVEGGPSVKAKAAHMFSLATGRPPEAGEVAELVAAYQEQREYYEQNPDAAAELLADFGQVSTGQDDPASLSAWTLLANVVLNLDEVVCRN
ncbi:MAG: PSD1 and planctomycete cytochrome C domain-containing protein, partial [Planctomycetota bacterium]